MSKSPRVTRLLGVLAAVAGALLVHAGSAAAESCVYDAVAKTVSAEITPGSAATLVVSAGELWFGFSPAPCGGATTTNTDTISIAGAAGSTEQLVFDHAGGTFAPGTEVENNAPEIEITTTLGDTADRISVLGTAGDDMFFPSLDGLRLNGDGDMDVIFAPTPAELVFELFTGHCG